MKSSTRAAAWTLLFLAPIIGEVLCGSTGPVEILNPFVLFLQTALYGCGALLMRELRVRWGGGALTLILLGCAYGIYEEGMVVASFFNPNWHDLGDMQYYGRALGTNWPWAFHLTVYHALQSIFLSVLLSEFLFPKVRNEEWLSRRGQNWCAVGLGIVLILCQMFFAGSGQTVLTIVPAIGCIAAMSGFIYAGFRVREFRFPRPRLSGSRAGWASFAAILGYFIYEFGTPKHMQAPSQIMGTILLGILLAMGAGRIGDRGSRQQQFGYLVGIGAFWGIGNILIHPKAGMIVDGLLMIALLVWATSKMRKDRQRQMLIAS